MTRFRSPSTRQSGEPQLDLRRGAPRSASWASGRSSATCARRVPSAAGVVVGIGDDAAAVEIGPFALVTTDSLVEGVHFHRESAPPRLLGRKALTVNLSDVAAMGGARPLRDRQPLPAGRDSRSAGSTRSTTACSSAPPRPGWRWSAATSRARRRDRRRRHAARRRRPAAAAQRRARGRRDRRDRRARRGRRGRAAAGRRRAARRRRRAGAQRHLDRVVDAPAVLACLRAQLDPRPPLALARSIAERGLAHAGDGPLRRPLERPARDLRAERRRRRARRCGRCPSTRAWRGSSGRAAATRSRWRCTAARTTSCCSRWPRRTSRSWASSARVWGVEVSAIGEFVAGEPEVPLRDGGGRAAARAGRPRPLRSRQRLGADGLAGAAAAAPAPGRRAARRASRSRSRSASSSRSSRSSASTPGLALADRASRSG